MTQPTRLHQRLAEGKVARGVIFSANSPAAAEAFCGAVQPDFVAVDLQLAATTPTDAQHLLRAVQAVDRLITPMARVPNHDVYWIQQVLDAGYEVLVVPLVESAEQAQALVRATYWPPTGSRSFAGSIRAQVVGPGLEHGNERVLLLPQIESARGLEHLEEIVAVEGLSGVLLGPEDLNISCGWPRADCWSHPPFQNAADRVVETCRRNGKWPAIFTGAPLAAKKAGFSIIGFSGDLAHIRTVMATDVSTKLAELDQEGAADGEPVASHDAGAARIATYQQTVDRFNQWMVRHLEPAGRWPQASSATAYFSSVAYANYIGRRDVSTSMLRHVQEQYVDEQGRLRQEPERDRMITYVPAWYVPGAFDAEMFDLGTKILDEVLSFQCPRCGGFFAGALEREAGRGLIDLDSTGISIIAAARAGRVEAAVKGADFLLRLCAAQPRQEECFYTVWSEPEGLLTKGEHAPESSVLRWAQPGQYFWKVGLFTATMAHTYGVTGNGAYLDAGVALHRRAVEQSPDLWTNTFSHKMCWSAAMLHHLTGDPSYLDEACRFADHLVTLQQPDGAFHYPELWPAFPPPRWESLPNVGAQFALWIARCLNALKSA